MQTFRTAYAINATSRISTIFPFSYQIRHHDDMRARQIWRHLTKSLHSDHDKSKTTHFTLLNEIYMQWREITVDHALKKLVFVNLAYHNDRTSTTY